MSRITTHILDTSAGRPAAGVSAELFVRINNSDWKLLSSGITDKDGRIKDLLNESIKITNGIYKMKFITKDYFEKNSIRCFYPFVEIVFEIDSEEHYHIPLLLSPFGYSTYRGS